jgi:AraC-like DNA-binding protein
MAHQLNIFFLLFGAVQGALVSFFLVRNSQRDRSHLYLAFLLTAISLQLTFKMIAKVWLMSNVHFLYNLSYCFPYLVTPLIYLFIRSRSKETTTWTAIALHFIPFTLSLVATAYAFQDGWSHSNILTAWTRHPFVAPSLQLAHLSIYFMLCRNRMNSSTAVNSSRLKEFLNYITVSEAIIIVTIALMYRFYGSFPDVRMLFLVLTFFIYWISYKLMADPQLFFPKEVSPVIALTVEQPNPKYAHSGLRPEDADKIAALLHDAMTHSKLFMEPDLTIETLAISLSISRHHLSQVINEKFQKSYFDFISSYRVEEARQRLMDRKYAHFTIAAIAMDSGFSSVSSFNEAFRKKFSLTPSKFRDESRKKMSA